MVMFSMRSREGHIRGASLFRSQTSSKGGEMKSVLENRIMKVAYVLIAAGLTLYYGWVAAPFVTRYICGPYEHIWFSTEQATKVQLLFLLAIMIGVFIRLSTDWWNERSEIGRWWVWANVVMAFLVMELPYIIAGVLDLLNWSTVKKGFYPIYDYASLTVQQRFGVGDFVVSTIGAIWLGTSVAMLLREFLKSRKNN